MILAFTPYLNRIKGTCGRSASFNNSPSITPIYLFLFIKTKRINLRGSMSELLALVDESDNIVTAEEKFKCHRRTPTHDHGKLHRAFSLFIFHPTQPNKMLMQRRAAKKHTFPLMWSNTACSHPSWPEEASVQVDSESGVKRAAVRRAQQELGVTIDSDQLTVVGRILYKAIANEMYAEWELDYLVFCRHHVDLSTFNKDEVHELAWVDIHSLKVDNPTPWFNKLDQSGILHRLWKQYQHPDQQQYDMTIMQI